MAIFKSKTQEEIARLTAENDELRNDMHSILAKHKDQNKLEAAIIDARKELALLNRENDKIQANINKLKESKKEIELIIRKHESELLSYKSKEKSLHSKIAFTKTELDNLVDQRIESARINQDLKDEAQKKKKEIDELNKIIESIENVREEEQEIKDKINLLKMEEETRLKNLDEVIEQTVVNERIKQELESSLGKIILRVDETTDRLNKRMYQKNNVLEEIQESKVELTRISAEIELLKKSIEVYEKEKTELLDEKERLGNEIKRFETIRNEVNAEILNKRETDEMLTKQTEELQKQVADLEKLKFEIQDANISIEKTLVDTMQKFTDEIKTSKDKLNSLREEILEKEKLLKEKENALSERSAHMLEYGAMNKVLSKEKDTLEITLAELKQEKDDVNTELLLLKENLASQKQVNSDLLSETNQLQSRRNELETSLKELLSKMSNDYSKTEESKIKIHEEISAKKETITEMNKEIEQSREELKKLKSEIKHLDLQKESFKSKVSELVGLEKKLKFTITQHEKYINENEIELEKEDEQPHKIDPLNEERRIQEG